MNLKTKALDAINKTNRFEELNERDEQIMKRMGEGIGLNLLHLREMENERKCLPC